MPAIPSEADARVVNHFCKHGCNADGEIDVLQVRSHDARQEKGIEDEASGEYIECPGTQSAEYPKKGSDRPQAITLVDDVMAIDQDHQ